MGSGSVVGEGRPIKLVGRLTTFCTAWKWCHHQVGSMLNWVATASPRSRVVYRTPPPMLGTGKGQSPAALREMSDCTQRKYRHKFDFIDYRTALEDAQHEGMPTSAILRDESRLGSVLFSLNMSIRFARRIVEYAHRVA